MPSPSRRTVSRARQLARRVARRRRFVLLLAAALVLPRLAACASGASRPGGVTSLASVVNVLAYGADATGTSESSTAINAALAAGSSVYMPCGTYALVAPVVLGSGQTLRGAGPCTVLVVPDTGFAGERVVTNADLENGNARIAISDFALRATAVSPVSGSRPGIIRFEKVDGLTIERIHSDTSFSVGYVAIDLAGGVRHATVSGCDIRNTYDAASGNSGALWVRGGGSKDPSYDSFDITITGNRFEGAGDETAGLYGWFNEISRVTFSGNVVVRGGTAGGLAFAITGYNVVGQDGAVADVAVSGNTIVGGTSIVTGVARVVFSSNAIVGPAVGTDDAINISPWTDDQPPPTDILVEDNTIDGGVRHGIYSAGTRVTLRGNRVRDVADTGIVADGGIVERNEIRNATSVGIQSNGSARVAGNTIVGGDHGISAFNGSVDAIAGTVIEDNVVEDAAAAGIMVNAWENATTDVTVRRNTVAARAATVAEAYDVGGTFARSVFEGNLALVRAGGTGSFGRIFTVATSGVRKAGNWSGDETGARTAWPATSGPTGARPALGAEDAGFVYQDTTLDAGGLPIRWNGTKWIKPDGTDA